MSQRASDSLIDQLGLPPAAGVKDMDMGEWRTSVLSMARSFAAAIDSNSKAIIRIAEAVEVNSKTISSDKTEDEIKEARGSRDVKIAIISGVILSSPAWLALAAKCLNLY